MLSGGQLASWLFSIGWVFVVPRKLGPAAIGEYVVAISTAAVLGVFINQGAGPLLTRDVARDSSRAPALMAATIFIRIVAAVPAYAVMLAYIQLASFGLERGELIWIASAIVTTTAITGAFGAAFAGFERMEYIAYASLVGNSLVSILGVVLVLFGGRVVALMLLDLGLALLTLALNFHWSRRVFRIDWHAAVSAAPYVLRGGLSFWVGGIFFVAYLWIDSILLSLLVPSNVVGWYGVPTQLFSSVLTIASVLCTAWFPQFASAYMRGPQSLAGSARPAAEAVLVLSIPIAAGTVLVAGPLIAFVYGAGFSGAAPVLAILGVCVVPTYFNMVAYQVLQAQGRQMSWCWVVAAATFVNVGINLILIPRFQAGGNGAIGAALSLLATEILEAGAAVYLLPWLVSRRLGTRLARTLAATLVMAIAVFAVSSVGFLAELGVGLLVFAFAAMLLKVPTTNELAVLRVVGLRVRGRLGLAASSS